MSKYRWKIFLLCSLLLFVPLLAACSSPEKKIVGKWQSPEGSVQFYDDGTVIFFQGETADSGNRASNYSIIDDHTLRIESPSGPLLLEFEISGNKLTLKEPGGSSESAVVFEKAK